MKKTFFLSLFAVLLFPVVALAQAVATAPPEVSLQDMLQQVLGTVSTWKTAGWMAGAVTLVNLLVNASKFKPVDDFLTGLKIGWWLRPLLSIILGIAAGVFSSLVGGAPAGTAVLIALVSGLSSTGFHELLGIASQKIQAERGVGSALVTAMTKPAEATTNGVPQADPLADLKGKLAEIEKLTPELRLQALANLGKKA